MKCRMRPVLEGFSDSDWQGGPGSKSTSASCIFLNGQMLAATSRTQRCISLSSTEAELHALTASCVDLLFVRHCIKFLLDEEPACVMHTDNMALKFLSERLGGGKLHHVEGKYLWIQQYVRSKQLSVKKVGTRDNPADVNTKCLTRKVFLRLLFMMQFIDCESHEPTGREEYENEIIRGDVKACILRISGEIAERSTGMRPTSTAAIQCAKSIFRIAVMSALCEKGGATSTDMTDFQLEINSLRRMVLALIFAVMVFLAVCVCGFAYMCLKWRKRIDSLVESKIDEKWEEVLEITRDMINYMSEFYYDWRREYSPRLRRLEAMQVQEQLRERGSPEPEPDSVQSEADELGIQNSSGLAESEPEDEPNFRRRTRQRMSGVASFS